MRDEVQSSVHGSSDGGFSTNKGSASAIPGTKKSKGYGKIAMQEATCSPLPTADENVESGKPPAAGSLDAADEILDADLEPRNAQPASSRHRRKKICLAGILLLLLVGGSAMLIFSGGDTEGLPVTPVDSVASAAGAASQAGAAASNSADMSSPGAAVSAPSLPPAAAAPTPNAPTAARRLLKWRESIREPLPRDTAVVLHPPPFQGQGQVRLRNTSYPCGSADASLHSAR